MYITLGGAQGGRNTGVKGVGSLWQAGIEIPRVVALPGKAGQKFETLHHTLQQRHLHKHSQCFSPSRSKLSAEGKLTKISTCDGLVFHPGE